MDELFPSDENKVDEKVPHYLGHRARLREKLLSKGGNSLADYEILELLLALVIPRRDVKELAKNLLKKFGNLGRIFAASSEQLMQVAGIKEQSVAMFKVVQAAHAKSLLAELKDAPNIINSWDTLLDYCRVNLGGVAVEEFHIIYLDTKFKMIADEVGQKGTIDKAAVYPREIVRRALDLNARSVILVHNHPSGDTNPSKDDVETTKRVRDALTLVGITLHDHLIISSSEHFSFKHSMLI